jgi:hypothetical protein
MFQCSFASAVSKRLASMGDLTKGDRRAASGSDLSEFDIDSTFGKVSHQIYEMSPFNIITNAQTT